MNTLTTEALRERLDAGPVALYDVRGDVAFEKGHRPGSYTAPLGSLSPRAIYPETAARD